MRLRLGPVAAFVAAVCLLPVVAVLVAALTGSFDTWRHLAATVLPGYALNTLVLCVSVAGLGTFPRDDLNLAELGRNQALAQTIYNDLGWK